MRGDLVLKQWEVIMKGTLSVYVQAKRNGNEKANKLVAKKNAMQVCPCNVL